MNISRRVFLSGSASLIVTTPMISKVFRSSAYSFFGCMLIFGLKKHIRREFIQTFFPYRNNIIGTRNLQAKK